MRIILVTSEVTFVKENYNAFLSEFFKNSTVLPISLIVLKNNNQSMLLKGAGLMAMGALKTGKNLLINSINSNKKDHQLIAKKYHIPTLYFNSANDKEFIKYVKKENIDLIINARTRDIYKKEILKTPRLGCINIHHGLLPDNRGTMCDLYALYENRPAGFSIHKMEKKIDDGEIYKVVPVTDKNSTDPLNFEKHIYESSKVEGKTLALFIDEINNLGKLPSGMENKSSNITYTKNPDYKLVKQMLKKGMVL